MASSGRRGCAARGVRRVGFVTSVFRGREYSVRGCPGALYFHSCPGALSCSKSGPEAYSYRQRRCEGLHTRRRAKRTASEASRFGTLDSCPRGRIFTAWPRVPSASTVLYPTCIPIRFSDPEPSSQQTTNRFTIRGREPETDPIAKQAFPANDALPCSALARSRDPLSPASRKLGPLSGWLAEPNEAAHGLHDGCCGPLLGLLRHAKLRRILRTISSECRHLIFWHGFVSC